MKKRLKLSEKKLRSVSSKKFHMLPSLKTRKSASPLPKKPLNSFLIGLKYFRLPEKFPRHLSYFESYVNFQGKSVPLWHTNKVKELLESLDRKIQPILIKFNLNYCSLSELDPSSRNCAFTNRVPLRYYGPNAYAHYIQIRVRNYTEPNNLRKIYNMQTLLAVLVHELAHIKHMDHSKDFVLLLRDIYAYAFKVNILKDNAEHQIPSCREWERIIYQKKGLVSDDDLLPLVS